jgi:predicted DCC family thiol-disulfide oxidoreductase YuxK
MRHQHIPVLIIDGNCALCNRSVRFILKHEKLAVLRFASNSSDLAKKIIEQSKLQDIDNETVILCDAQGIHLRSNAVFKVLALLKPPFSWFRFLVFLPSGFTDFIYNIVASNRMNWFGTASYCALDPGIDLSRFLD